MKTVSDTGMEFYGARIFVRSPKSLHDTDEDDDRSAVTLWCPAMRIESGWSHQGNILQTIGHKLVEVGQEILEKNQGQQ